MTSAGKLALITYSIVVILIVIIRDFKSEKGWLSAILLPTLILLINLI